ncbi:2'-5' RNA ligase family protein [Dyadobacter sp. CY326]|uniref:2'-5' RNA ligase family protein n=1 Tax=Dyadobacter sp. CY326 TaxID=2907300 RepID=UPI001F43E97A|nr:2'-5' RNA ligase family protein [Dyadobacter sp. CY326]MCE7066614.1 2'-5' RNA ligase family protein [Dyadobacter sp. CY326]
MKSVHINNNHWNTLASIRHHMYEYMLVFSCDPVTEALIHNVKRYFEDNYGCSYAANLVPHLMLFQCTIHENKVDRILQGIEKVARHVSPFDISLTKFNKYERGTFYVDLESQASQQIIELTKKLKTEVGSHVKQWAPGEYHFCEDPHFTVARNMSALQVAKATLDWLYREFLATFPATNMVLLRRSLVNGSKYEQIAQFPLLGMPAGDYMQGSLF